MDYIAITHCTGLACDAEAETVAWVRIPVGSCCRRCDTHQLTRRAMSNRPSQRSQCSAPNRNRWIVISPHSHRRGDVMEFNNIHRYYVRTAPFFGGLVMAV